MGRPRSGTHDIETRTRLLDAAEREFGEHGFEGAQLARIAEAAHITRASLLHHFASKEALHAEMAERVFEALGEGLSLLMRGEGSTEERIASASAGLLVFLKARPGIAGVVLHAISRPDGPATAEVVAAAVRLLGRMERLLGGEVPGAVPLRLRLLAIAFTAMAHQASGAHRALLFACGPEELVALSSGLLAPQPLARPPPKRRHVRQEKRP